MLDTAIVGGGLCGLALADSLQTLGRDFALFEARAGLGGRIRSVPGPSAGTAFDLGPTWFWPATDPSLGGLIADLGLASFPQHDDGTAGRLDKVDGKLEPMAVSDLHAGAHRVVGGMAALVGALAARLPGDRVHTGHVLAAVCKRGDHVELLFHCGEVSRAVQARRVVLAMPPRLVAERVCFDPPLPDALRETLRATPTWMAVAAKAVAAYPRPFWREGGHSGNAFVTHEQATLAEVFDACGPDGSSPALGGFLALPPNLREAFRDGLPMLIQSQFAQLYGPDLEQGELHYHDWARDAFTAAPLDLTAPHDAEPAYGAPLLAEPAWDGRLLFGGSETASYGGGRMEGALAAAGRLRRLLVPQSSQGSGVKVSAGVVNDRCAAEFGAWVADRRGEALEDYRQRLNRALSMQDREQLTQRAVLETMEAMYRDAVDRLRALAFETHGVGVERGRSDLTPSILAPFIGSSEALLDEALRFNRSSCALSNFPTEHAPSGDYVNAIRRDLAAAWREFAFAANDLLVARTTSAAPRPLHPV